VWESIEFDKDASIPKGRMGGRGIEINRPDSKDILFICGGVHVEGPGNKTILNYLVANRKIEWQITEWLNDSWILSVQ
jgi:hypothetical protein